MSTTLAPVYFLRSIDSQFLPARYADSASFQLRALSDTIRLSFVDSTYREAGLTGRRDPATGVEVTRNYALATTPKFSGLKFPQFLGGSATATVTPGFGNAMLTLVTPGGQVWVFNP